MTKVAVPRGLREPNEQWMNAVADNIESITGRKGGRLAHARYVDDVPTMAQFNALVDAFNALLDRLQS